MGPKIAHCILNLRHTVKENEAVAQPSFREVVNIIQFTHFYVYTYDKVIKSYIFLGNNLRIMMFIFLKKGQLLDAK